MLGPLALILVIQGPMGKPLGAHWGPDLDFYRFFVDLGSLLGLNLLSFWCYFRDLGRQGDSMGSRVGFLVVWEWK